MSETIKGCQREMIVLQTKQSALFESAYFVIRRGRHNARSTDMLAEANRIIGEGSGYFVRRRAKHVVLPFVLGLLLGMGAFALILCIMGA